MVLCVEGSIWVQLSMGAWYGLWWVWLERCWDGSYAANELHCDVCVVCACIVPCFIGFWGSVFWWKCMTCYCTFWQSALSVTCFGAFLGR